MPKKTQTKTVKKTATKKPVAKKAVAKKPVAKKTVTKRVARKPRVVVAPVVDTKPVCACGDNCHCCCCRGHRFLRWGIRVILLCIVFVCGMAVAPLFMRDMPQKHMQFDDNGCVILESVTCPKMLEVLATADTDANGCITRDEIRAAKHNARHAEPVADAPVAE